MPKQEPTEEQLDAADLECDLIAWQVTEAIDQQGGGR